MAKLNDFLKGMGRGEILVPHLDKWFKKDFTDHPDIPISVQMYKPSDDAFHPSGHAMGCSRLIYAAFDPELEPAKKTFNPKVGANGHMWHGLLQWIVVEGLGFATWDDIEARRGIYQPMDSDLSRERWHEGYRPEDAAWWGTGALDIVNLTVPGYDEKYLVDIKTMNPGQFKMPKPSEGLWNKYVAQCQLYMDWADLDTTILLGVEAGNPFKFKEIQIDRDPDHVDYIYHKWDQVAEGLLNGTPPPHSCLEPDECASLALYGDTKEASTA
jgi:hypothetical protein